MDAKTGLGYDPKLKQAAAEMRNILKKYDISAFVSLTSKTHSEFVFHLPTWSGVQFEEDANGHTQFRIKIKKEEQAKAEATTWMVYGSLELLAQGMKQFDMLLDVLKSKALVMLPGGPREPLKHRPEMDET